MAPLETVFIVNPHADGGSLSARWPRIARSAEQILGKCQAVLTRLPGDATVLAAAAVAQGARRLVVVGGDGTLNEVVNALMALDRSLRERIFLGLVPNGTGCDFARSVAIPRDTADALTLIRDMPPRPIDVGRILFKGPGGKASRRFFLNVASFGLGGEVARRVRKSPRSLGPTFAFCWATLIALLQYGKKRIHLNIDGAFARTGRSWNVAVANGRYHGGGMLVAPDARPDDGMFHITVIGDLPLSRVFLNLRHLYDGKIQKVKGVSVFPCTRVDAASDLPVLLDVDGEGPGGLPSVLSLLPQALNMIRPDPPADGGPEKRNVPW
jgi:YegS/Rv2252/BmrU family lipid kinase